MILAVHIGGNQAPDCDEFSTGHDRREPTPWDDKRQKIREQHACFALDLAGVRVEFENAIAAVHEQSLVRVKRGVAIGSPISTSDQRSASLKERTNFRRLAE